LQSLPNNRITLTGEAKNAYRFFMGKPERNRPHGIPMHSEITKTT
jgi:hypothetical protein